MDLGYFFILIIGLFLFLISMTIFVKFIRAGLAILASLSMIYYLFIADPNTKKIMDQYSKNIIDSISNNIDYDKYNNLIQKIDLTKR